MHSMIIGILKDGAKDQLADYYDRPFDVFEEYYDIPNLHRMSQEWHQLLGERTQMDWGSWLSVCSSDTVQQLFEPSFCIVRITPAEKPGGIAKFGKPQSISELPKAKWYGILEVEDY